MKTEPLKKIKIKDFDGDNVPENFDFPSIGIENIDRAVFELFDKQLSFETESQGKIRSVPVIFATGERFALTRRKKAIRDKNNTNILPLISIVRENMDISPGQSGKGTAISFRAQPGYYIKKRLSDKDREFQNLINKDGIKNQDNVTSEKNFIDTSSKTGVEPGNTSSRREKKNLKFSAVSSVSINNDNINTNIFEFISTPYPYFITLTYNITFWCQYMQQGNDMIEYFLTKIDVPGGEFAIKTKEGYELVAFVGDNITFNNNFDSMTDDERIIKYSTTLTVPGYIINPKAPGLSSMLRSYYSAPQINFGYYQASGNIVKDSETETKKEKLNKHILSDINSKNQVERDKYDGSENVEIYVQNPFNQNVEKEYLKVKNVNTRSGESIISPDIIKEIDRQFE